jgi:predicted branched-subunit amino acid permease
MNGYLVADLSYVQFVSKFTKPGTLRAEHQEQDAYLAGNTGLTWVAWMGASLLGIAMAAQVPVSWGLGFAGILSLLGILCSLATSKFRVVAAVVSSFVAVAAYALPLKMNIVVAISAAVALCLLLDKTQRTMQKAEEKAEEKAKDIA